MLKARQRQSPTRLFFLVLGKLCRCRLVIAACGLTTTGGKETGYGPLRSGCSDWHTKSPNASVDKLRTTNHIVNQNNDYWL